METLQKGIQTLSMLMRLMVNKMRYSSYEMWCFEDFIKISEQLREIVNSYRELKGQPKIDEKYINIMEISEPTQNSVYTKFNNREITYTIYGSASINSIIVREDLIFKTKDFIQKCVKKNPKYYFVTEN